MQAVPSEFLAIDRKERANKPFCDLDLRPAQIRTNDFEDVVIEFNANAPCFKPRAAFTAPIRSHACWLVRHTMIFLRLCG